MTALGPDQTGAAHSHGVDARAANPRDLDPADVVLGLATRLLWRTHNTIHLELAGRAVLVERLPQPVITRVASSAPTHPGPPRELAPDTREALAELTAQGYLWPRPTSPEDPRLIPTAPRLSGELTALAARHGDRAAEVLVGRRSRSVVVHGHPRVATHLAALLAAAGVGRVRCVAQGTARLLHAAPGGVAPDDEGLDLDVVAHAAIERAAPEVDTTPLPFDEHPDLVVLVLEGPLDDDRRAGLHADGTAHLAVQSTPSGGIVGPLVIPGQRACLRCTDLHRTDRDPSWSALAAQLSIPQRHGSACDIAAEAIVAGTAAAQALAYLDGAEVAAIEGTIEFAPPDWRLRRRSWPAHESCGCGAARAGGWAQ